MTKLIFNVWGVSDRIGNRVRHDIGLLPGQLLFCISMNYPQHIPTEGADVVSPAEFDRFCDRSHGKMGRFGKIYQIRGDSIVAVPKKKTSKSRRDKRRATWKHKAAVEAKKALSLGKSVLTGRSTGFIYPTSEDDDEE